MNEIETSFYSEFYNQFRKTKHLSNESWDCDVTTKTYDCPQIYKGLCLYSEFKACDYKEAKVIYAQLVIIPQFKVRKYYLDFLMAGLFEKYGPFGGMGIEIDGHEWHEKTKQQASKDRKRDRDVLFESIPTLRFTGSEVYKDVKSCVSEAVNCYLNLVFYDYYKRELQDLGYK